MTPKQSAMARALLEWSRADLAAEAGLSAPTVVRFETGQQVAADSVAAMRAAFEKRRVKFVDDGPMAGAVYSGLRPTKGPDA